MATNISGGNGKLSFEEWRKQRSNSASTPLGGSENKLSFEEWKNAKYKKLPYASPVLRESKKGIFDTSAKTFADTVGIPLWNQAEIDNGELRKAEQLKAAAEKLSTMPLTAEEKQKLDTATMLRLSRRDREADALDSEIRARQQQYKAQNSGAVSRLKELAYKTEQAGVKTVSEKLAQSDPEYYAKAAAGYADKSNPIQKQRAKVISALPDGADYGVMGATLENQLSKIESGEKNGAIGTGLLNGMSGVNPADLTADELKTYSYWYQKSPNAAKRYLESISADVNKRTAEREAQFYSENSRELRDSGIGGTALALGRDLMVDYASPAAIASAAAAKLSGKPYDPNTSVNRVVTNSSAMQEGLTGDLPTLGKFLADTGISTAQYLARIPLGAAGLVVMASGAAGKTANEVKRSGGTTDQALTLGTVAGLAEYASEKIPFENIKAAFNGGDKKGLALAIQKAIEKITKTKVGSSVARVVGSTLEEGVEEVISEYINNIANDVVLGDASDMKRYALELISQGMSYEDATKAAFKQYYVTNPLVAFAGGALSGGVMAGVGETWANRRNIPRAIVNAGEENLRTQMQKNQAVNAEIPVDNKAAEVSVEAPAETAAKTETVNEEPQVMPKNQFANPVGGIVLDTAEQASRKQRANAAKSDVERSGILAGASDADIAIAKSLSETFGRKIVFDSSDASVNGKFANGTIYVNPDGSDNVVTILAHELTHSAEGTEEYNTLKRCLKKNLADRGVMWSTVLDDVRSRYEYRYKRMGQEFTNDDCESEALALAAQALFSDNASMQEFVKQNRSAASRLWHKVSQAVERLKQDISFRFGRGEKDEEARKRQLAIRQLEDARDALAAALRATEKGNDNKSVRNSFAERKIPSYDELIAKPDMNIIDIGSEDKSRPFNEQNRYFKQSTEAKEICKEPVVNRDTGEKIFITPATFTHLFSDKTRFKQNLARNIRTVLENAVLTHAEPPTHGATNTQGVYTLFAAVRTDDSVRPVKITVKEYEYDYRNTPVKNILEYFERNGKENPYSSVYDGRILELESVEEIKTEAVSSSALRNSDYSARSKYPSTASTISIADFLPLVNSESKKYLPEKSDNSIKTDKTNYSLADSALSRAKQMEADGASPMTIKNATGWYRDDSGSWKKQWNKSGNMFNAEIDRTERNANGGINQMLADRKAPAAQLDEITSSAKKHFGITYDWNKAGYILTDGSRLDFSGKHQGYDTGMRSVDHRDIGEVYSDDSDGVNAMIDFMQKGNIRIMPESNSINLSAAPTAKQETALRQFIRRVNGEVIVDIDDANGKTVRSLEYDSGTSAEKILNDISQYFSKGAGNESDIAMFHRMGDQYSVNNSQYGTKALNTAEEINRKKALDMLSKGKDPEHVFELTGWFYDNFGTFMVDHGAEMYSFGENDVKPAKKAENGKANTESEVKPKSEQIGEEALREAYRRGEREAQRAITKALNTDPDMMPDATFVKGLVDDASGENVSADKKREFTERLTELYDRMGDADANGVRAMSQQDIADSFNKLATDILDSREYIDGERERIQKDLKKEFKTSMFVSPTTRGDFAEGWNKVRKSYFGKLNLTSDRAKGVPVDVRYMELNQTYPEWFPDNIENETEQLEHMMNICDRVFDKRFAVESYYNFSGWENEYSKDHDDIVRKLSDGYRDLKQQPRTWYDDFVKRLNNYRENTARIHESEIKKITEAAEKDAEEQLARYEQLMIETQKQNAEREKEIRDYYEGREQDRLDRENKEKAEREAKRRRRGGEIDMTRLSEALGDNSFSDKMKKLWDAQKKLSKEVEKYADVDLETITDADLKKHIENIRERLDDMNTYINRIGQAVRRIKRRTALETIAKGDIMKWVDKKSGYLYSRETTRRNIEDISKGDELGKEIIKEYIDPIQRDVALSTRFKESLRQRVKALDLGMKPTGNNKLSESAFVQLLGEARDNVYMLENDYGADITTSSGERIREGKTLSEWQAILDTLMAENRDMDMDKINRAITEFQNIYDELFELINNVRVLNGYAPADYHHGYFPHYNNDAGTDGIISSLFTGLGFDLDTEGLPTSINGLTHVFRPGTKYMSNLKQRSVYGVGEQYNGFTLNSGAVEGFDRYLETAADVIFLTGDIQNLRALSDAIRYSTTDEGVKNQVDSIREDWKLTAQEQDSLIAELYSGKQKFHLRNFVIDLEEYTNMLAGKKSIKDRQWEQNFGRGMYQVMKKVEQRITANQIALNPGSWLTNFVPLAQAGSVLTPRQMLGAMLDTMKATMNDDGFATRSDFLTNRRGSDSLVKTGAQKFQDAMSKPMELIDGFTSETIVRARYAQNLKKGMTEAEALHEADIFTNKLMANRAKGDMPTLFYSVNPVSKLFTMYQLEVNNQWSFMFKDLPKEAKDAGKNLAAMLFKLCIGSWLYNEIYEMIVGRRCAFDPIDMLNDFVGDLTGYKLPSVSKALDTALNPEKIDELFKAKKVGVTNATVNLGKNAIEEAPFFGGIIGGGRIPISNALPNFGNLISSFDYSSEKAGSKRWEMRLKEGAKPLFYMLPPYGGGQIKKAIEGATAFAQGGSYIRDNEGKKQLQYPIENQTVGQVATNLPRALLFGKTANKYGREWIDNGFGKYSAKATEAYQALVDDGISQADALKAVDKIKGEEKRAGKVKALREIGGSSEAKRAVFEKMILSSEDSIKAAAEKLDSIDSAGISFDNYLDAYDTYLSVSGDMRKLDVISTINRMKLSDSQKDILYCCFYKEGGLADTPWHSNGVMKAVLPEIGLPDVKMPEIKMPDIKLPGLK